MKKLFDYFASIAKILFLVFFSCICVWFIISQITLPSEQNPRDFFVTEYNDNWFFVNDGQKIPFEVPGSCDIKQGETAIFTNTLPANIPSNLWLCFRTSRQDMFVYIDDELRESFSTKKTRPFGVASASTYLFVQLLPSDSQKTIELHSSSDSVYSGVMRTVLLGDKTGIIFNLLKNNFWTLALSVFMLLLAIITIISSHILQFQIKESVNLRYFGWCVTAVSIWIMTQSNLRQLFFPNVSVASSFSEFMKYLAPIPFAQYMDSIQKHRYHRIYVTVQFFSVINFVVNTIAIVFSITDHTTLNPNYYTILISLIIVTFTTLLKDCRNKHIKDYFIVGYGIVGVLITCIIQINFTIHKEQLYNINMVCIGFGFMLVMAFIQTIMNVISMEKQKQKALYESEAKAHFLAGMSHEIRTPINAVLGIDEMIARETTEDNIRDYAQDIQTAGRSLLAIVNDILDFSKIESGKMRIIVQDYDLSSVINDSCSIVRVKADEKGLDFKIICNENLPSRLMGDEIRIRQILVNLLSNAVKYTKEGSITLNIDASSKDNGKINLIFSVKDTGIGIKEENIPYLFDSFSRIDEETNHKIEGTGLGLNIVGNLVELMNGTITVESKYSQGSCFTVTIPQEIVSDTPIGNYADIYSNKVYNNSIDFVAPKAKILVVDDVPINLKVFCGLLKDTLIKIDTAKSGRECITKLHSDTYNIILLDDMMPELNGVETLNKINSISENRHKNVPVIMLTANAVTGAREEYLKQGFSDYLSKPIQKEKLVNIIKQHLPKELIISKEHYNPDNDCINLDDITFLNTDSGLSYYGGDKEFYLEIIEAILESDYYEKLQAFYDKKDWRNYQITAHSLKSTSKSIGAEDVSELAKQLEFAAKDNDIDFIRENHDKTLALYASLLKNIRELFQKSTSS